MTFQDLMSWQYLIFDLPMVFAMLYVLFLMLSGVDIDIGADVDTDVDGDHSGAEHLMDGDHDPGLLLKALSVLGIGRIPISLVVITFCFSWGFIGILCNFTLTQIWDAPFFYFWISLAVTIPVSLLFTRWVAKLLYRFFPTTESYGSTNEELVGSSAHVRYTITKESGTAFVKDKYGNLIQVECRLENDQEKIPPDSKILLIAYFKDGQYFTVSDDTTDI